MNNNNPYNNPLKFEVNSDKTKAVRKPFRVRNPRAFVITWTSAALLVFFSKPLYDLFFSNEQFDIEELRKQHKPRFAK